jgi:hypothetical protein
MRPLEHASVKAGDRVGSKLQLGWLALTRKLPLSDGQWRLSRLPAPDDPAQGWKLHVSATILSAPDVFARVAPILRKRNAFYKVASTFEFLGSLNSGLIDFPQVGKFLTVYPRSTAEAVELARELHLATRGLSGPEIPFDARYRTRSLVHYRYGSFRAAKKSASRRTIVDHRGKKHLDKRAPGCAIPRWLEDPFQKRRPKSNHALVGFPLGPEFLTYRAISQRGKGGVYEAVDLTVSPARVVIIKEGRRHGETAPDGEDGFDRVGCEARVLRALRGTGLPVPAVFREFTRNRNRYVVLEKISGRQLRIQQPSWRGAEKILDRLGALLSILHTAGWVWRDCKPSHIFVDGSELRFIDFEGACRINETEILPWASLNYLPPTYRGKLWRRAGTLEDDYALGVIAFQIGTGKLPPLIAGRRNTIYLRTGCPESLRLKIEKLLRAGLGT